MRDTYYTYGKMRNKSNVQVQNWNKRYRLEYLDATGGEGGGVIQRRLLT
jgi:hypothetical protein